MINYPVNNFKNSPYKNFLEVQSLPQLPSEPLPAVKVGGVQEEKTPHKSNRRLFGIIGLSVASMSLLTLIGLFTLSKGFSSGFAKRITALSDKIKNTIFELSNETKKLSFPQKLKLRFSKALQPIADGLQASSNITAIKDSLFHKMLKKCRLETVIKKTNELFKNKVVLKTKNQAYQSAELATIDFCHFLENIAQKENNSQLKEKASQILAQYTKEFSTSSHVQRTNSAWANMQGLDDKVYDALFKSESGFFKNLKNLKSYITTDFIAKDQKVLKNRLFSSKALISNNITDVYNSIKQTLRDLKVEINSKNEKAVNLIKSITQNIEESRKLKGETEKIARGELLSKAKVSLKELVEIAKQDCKNHIQLSKIATKSDNLLEALSEKSLQKGLVQEAITLLKQNSEQYKVAKKLAEKMNSKLNTAIASEVNTMEKLAELQVGSVPTDILGILAPSALATGLIVSSDTKNEKISTILTQGIPIIGGIGVSYYGMIRGFTGVKNLVLGLVTGSVLNILGTKTDEFYKKYVEKQNLLKKTFEAFNKLQAKPETTKN